MWPSLKKILIRKEFSPYEVLAISDIVVGMSSIMLVHVHAILFEKLTISLQINSLVDSQLAATKAGAIPFINTEEVGKDILKLALSDNFYRERYL